MTSEKMKSTKILEELIGYFFNHNIYHLNMSLAYESTHFTISVEGNIASRPSDLDHLDELLNTPRQEELEEYYWGLLGGNNQRQELNLLGALVDHADVKYENNQLSITVCRKTLG